MRTLKKKEKIVIIKKTLSTKTFLFSILLILLFLSLSIGGDIEFNEQKSFNYLIKQTDFGPRNPGSIGHQECLDFLKTELENLGALIQLQPFLFYDTELKKSFTLTNIIGSFYPNNPFRIILCAHWDTRPMADRDSRENQNKPILGANDGASGVAVLLEIARILQLREPNIGVDIIFFDGEDYGKEGELENYCMGSRYFIENNTKFFPNFAILLDMIGDAKLEIPIEGYSQHHAPNVVERVWKAAEELGYYQFIPEVRHYVFDDHVLLNEGGIPSIDIIDFEYPDASHRFWHTLEDTPINCSQESLKVVGDVILKVIYEF
jgi:glutaminyl-peptide cyclotransferase